MAIIFFTQCKKGSSPNNSDDTYKRIETGKYIIRSKYFCNGGCFVFRSISNYEAVNWEWIDKETLESIKDDSDPYNSYVWNINNTGALGSGIVIYYDPSNPNEVGQKLLDPLPYYAIYQQKPDGFFNYLPADILPDGYTQDDGDTGGPSRYVSMLSTDISPDNKDFDHNPVRLFLPQITDSTYRISLLRNSAWATYFSLLVNPNGSDCDELETINSRPTWRSSWLCPNTSTIGNAWLADACYTSQIVIEKAN